MSIVFLPVPENIQEQLTGEFPIDDTIPIPVEIGEKDDIKNLSVEMIISALLRVIEERQVKQEWLDYYSRLVLFLRPDIIKKLQEIKDNGLDDENFIKAHKLIQEGKPEEGLYRIHNFIERFPLVWNGWFILGWALRLLGRYKDAQAALEKALELGGDNSVTRNELSLCLQNNNS